MFFDALYGGLLLTGRVDQEPCWAFGDQFQITRRGVQVLAKGMLVFFDSGSLRAALLEARNRDGLLVKDAEIELLSEAQRCWQTGCYRAAVVLTGLANESRCLSLVDVLVATMSVAGSTATAEVKSDLAQAVKQDNQFSARWRPTLRLLGRVRQGLQNQGRGAPWWGEWEGIPGCLETLGEAVRASRNAGAHDATRTFGANEVALLLGSMPHQIRVVARLTAFLQEPPQGVTLPGW